MAILIWQICPCDLQPLLPMSPSEPARAKRALSDNCLFDSIEGLGWTPDGQRQGRQALGCHCDRGWGLFCCQDESPGRQHLHQLWARFYKTWQNLDSMTGGMNQLSLPISTWVWSVETSAGPEIGSFSESFYAFLSSSLRTGQVLRNGFRANPRPATTPGVALGIPFSYRLHCPCL
jgi:hypothetical protein